MKFFQSKISNTNFLLSAITRLYLKKFHLLILIYALTFFAFSQIAQAANDKTLTGIPVSAEAKALLEQKWDDSSIEKSLTLIGNRNESVNSRRAILEKFKKEERKLNSETLIRLFNKTMLLAKDSTEPFELSITAIRTMENAGLLLKERKQFTKADIRRDVSFLIEIAKNKDRDLKLRGTAIRATGVLGVEEAIVLLRELLADPIESSKPEIAQNALLTIGRLEGNDAIGTISEVFGRTQNPMIFGTAAFSLGQIKTTESMAKLVQNEDRFPNSGLPDAALVEMEDTILGVLTNPHDENLSDAIKATRHLWRKGQKERYVSKLHELLTTAPLEIRKRALDRLLEVASSLRLDEEKLELKIILPLIAHQSELEEYSWRIQRRLNAIVLFPQVTITTPKRLGLKIR